MDAFTWLISALARKHKFLCIAARVEVESPHAERLNHTYFFSIHTSRIGSGLGTKSLSGFKLKIFMTDGPVCRPKKLTTTLIQQSKISSSLYFPCSKLLDDPTLACESKPA